MQLVPFPARNPLNPSSRHIFARAFRTDILYSVLPADCTWNKILSRSNGDTTVLETAPAIPPAINEAKIGCDTVWRKAWKRGGEDSGTVAGEGYITINKGAPPERVKDIITLVVFGTAFKLGILIFNWQCSSICRSITPSRVNSRELMNNLGQTSGIHGLWWNVGKWG